MAPALLAIKLVPNDTGKPQGGFVGGEVHLTPPNNFLRVNGGHSLDKRAVSQLRLIGFEKQRLSTPI